MAWTKVSVKAGKITCEGMFNGDLLEVPNLIKDPSNIVIDKKNYEVLSSSVDERDNVLKIKLANASTKKEKSDDKRNEGSS
tara:strand:- start:204 stop:446 length:243 start_codon:yes stop_codon:yes gene_type:complete